MGYSYEGDLFQDVWWFEGGIDGAIEVTYNDGGTGLSGKLSDAEIEI